MKLDNVFAILASAALRTEKDKRTEESPPEPAQRPNFSQSTMIIVDKKQASSGLEVRPLGYYSGLYLKFRIWLGKKFFPQHISTLVIGNGKNKPNKKHYRAKIVNLGFGQYLKTTATVNEARALDYLPKHTNIPVPRVYSAWKALNRPNALCYVIMSKIPGETLQEAWPDLDEYQRVCIVRRLRTFVETLNSSEQPLHIRDTFCSFDGRPIKDPGLNPVWVGARLKHFLDVDTLVDYLLEPFQRPGEEILPEDKPTLLRDANTRPVLTHADLTMRNIMVDKRTAQITGLTDFGMVSWMPPYWERYKAMWSEQGLNARKKSFINKAFGAFEAEMEVVKRMDSALSTGKKRQTSAAKIDLHARNKEDHA